MLPTLAAHGSLSQSQNQQHPAQWAPVSGRFPLHTASNQPTSHFPHSVKENKTKIGVLALDTCMSSVTRIPDYGPMSYLPGSVFKYSLDLIHFFFPKVNNGEMNPPILLDACLPRK